MNVRTFFFTFLCLFVGLRAAGEPVVVEHPGEIGGDRFDPFGMHESGEWEDSGGVNYRDESGSLPDQNEINAQRAAEGEGDSGVGSLTGDESELSGLTIEPDSFPPLDPVVLNPGVGEQGSEIFDPVNQEESQNILPGEGSVEPLVTVDQSTLVPGQPGGLVIDTGGPPTPGPAPTAREHQFAQKVDNQMARFDGVVEKIAQLSTNKTQAAFEIANSLEQALAILEIGMSRNALGTEKTYDQQLQTVAAHTQDIAFRQKVERARAKLALALNSQRTASFSLMNRAVESDSSGEIRATAQRLFGLTDTGEIDPTVKLGSTAQEAAFRKFGEQMWADAQDPQALKKIMEHERTVVFNQMADALTMLARQPGHISDTASSTWFAQEKNTLNNLATLLTPVFENQLPQVARQAGLLNQHAQAALDQQNYQAALLDAYRSQDVTQPLRRVLEKLKAVSSGDQFHTVTELFPNTAVDSLSLESQTIYVKSVSKLQAVTFKETAGAVSMLTKMVKTDNASQITNVIAGIKTQFTEILPQRGITKELTTYFDNEIARSKKEIERFNSNNESQSAALAKQQQRQFEQIQNVLAMGKQLQADMTAAQKYAEVILPMEQQVTSLDVKLFEQRNTSNRPLRASLREQSEETLNSVATQLNTPQSMQERQQLRQRLDEVQSTLKDLEHSRKIEHDQATKYQRDIKEWNTVLLSPEKVGGSANDAIQQVITAGFVRLETQVIDIQSAMNQSDSFYSGETVATNALENQLHLVQAHFLLTSPGFDEVTVTLFKDLELLLDGKQKVVSLDGVSEIKKLSGTRRVEVLKEKLPEWEAAYQSLDPTLLRDNVLAAEDISVVQRKKLIQFKAFGSALWRGKQELEKQVPPNSSVTNFATDALTSLPDVLEKVVRLAALSPTLEQTIHPLRDRLTQDQQALTTLQTNAAENVQKLKTATVKYLEAFDPTDRQQYAQEMERLYEEQNTLFETTYSMRHTLKEIQNLAASYGTLAHEGYGDDFSEITGYDSKNPKNSLVGENILASLKPSRILEPDQEGPLAEMGKNLLTVDLPLVVVSNAEGGIYTMDSLHTMIAQKRYQALGFEGPFDWDSVNDDFFRSVAIKWVEPFKSKAPIDLSVEQLRTISDGYFQYNRDHVNNTGQPYRNFNTDILSSPDALEAFYEYFSLKKGVSVVRPTDDQVINIALEGNQLGMSISEFQQNVFEPIQVWLETDVGELRTAVRATQFMDSLDMQHLSKLSGKELTDLVLPKLHALQNDVLGGRELPAPGWEESGKLPASRITVSQHILALDISDMASNIEILRNLKEGEPFDKAAGQIVMERVENASAAALKIQEALVKSRSFSYKQRQTVQRFQRSLPVFEACVEIMAAANDPRVSSLNAKITSTQGWLKNQSIQTALQHLSPEQLNQEYLDYVVGETGLVYGTLRRTTMAQLLNTTLKQDQGLSLQPESIKEAKQNLPGLRKTVQDELNFLNELTWAQKDPQVIERKKQLKAALRDLAKLPERLEAWQAAYGK